jgi:hypothetical protein
MHVKLPLILLGWGHHMYRQVRDTIIIRNEVASAQISAPKSQQPPLSNTLHNTLPLPRLPRLPSLIIPPHSLRNELRARKFRILPRAPLDQTPFTRLVEVRQAIPSLLILAWLWRTHPVEVRLEGVVRDVHEHVADVADYGVGFGGDGVPGVAPAELGVGFAAGAHF